jgi:hypothetical protein
MKRVKSEVSLFLYYPFFISTMKPRRWRVDNLLSKLPCHLFTYSSVFQKTHIFPLMREYSVLAGLNISV